MVHEYSHQVSSARQIDGLSEFLQLIVFELLDLHYRALNAPFLRKNSHIRQVTVYLLNVSFGISMRQLAKIYKLNRSTIAYACQTVEDRRDDPIYDRFIEATERISSLAAAKHNEV